jgi:hypothetical protein
MEKLVDATGNKGVKVSKPGRKPKLALSSSSKFYTGTVKDGVPMLEREVSEQEALLDFIKTNRPFLSVQVWKVTSELQGDKLVISKSPAAV